MEIHRINDVLAQLENDRANGRDHIITLAATLIEWMGFAYVKTTGPDCWILKR